jgi:peptidoglycan hydrolase CwlO-like protein
MIYTWQERCSQFEDGRIVTNAKIQQMMQEEIDELRSKVDKMQDDIVSLTDDLFAERRECLKLEKELAKASEK